MSRKTRARRKSRKVRADLAPEAAAGEWAAQPARPFTPEAWLTERDRRAEKLEKAAKRLGQVQSALAENQHDSG